MIYNEYVFVLVPFLTVLLGGVTAWFIKPQSKARIHLLLTFSGAFLLSNVALELLPELYGSGPGNAGLWLIIGVFIQIILEFFSKGAEHGHMHIKHQDRRFPFLLFLSLCLHSFIEGMPLSDTHHLVYGISVHKLPIAFIFASFLWNSHMSKVTAISLLFLFAVMTPLGTLVMQHTPFLAGDMIAVKGIVAGVVLHVSTTLILEASEGHKFNAVKLLVMLIGALLALGV